MDAVRIDYGPYEAFGVIEHRIQKIRGLIKRLKELGYAVELKEVSLLNRLEIVMCCRKIFQCNIRNLKFNMDCDDDPVCKRIVDIVEEASNRISQELSSSLPKESKEFRPSKSQPMDLEECKKQDIIQLYYDEQRRLEMIEQGEEEEEGDYGFPEAIQFDARKRLEPQKLIEKDKHKIREEVKFKEGDEREIIEPQKMYEKDEEEESQSKFREETKFEENIEGERLEHQKMNERDEEAENKYKIQEETKVGENIARETLEVESESKFREAIKFEEHCDRERLEAKKMEEILKKGREEAERNY